MYQIKTLKFYVWDKSVFKVTNSSVPISSPDEIDEAVNGAIEELNRRGCEVKNIQFQDNIVETHNKMFANTDGYYEVVNTIMRTYTITYTT